MENFGNLRKKQHLREVLLGHYFSKKTAAESHSLLVKTYGEHAISKHSALNDLITSKLTITILKIKNELGSRKGLKMKSWKHYWIRIRPKRKKNLLNHWKLTVLPLLNAYVPWE